MSNNQLSDLDALGFSCPNLEHLQISGNPIPCNFDVLQPLKYLKELMSLDASRTPIATHPEYSIYVRSNLTVQVTKKTCTHIKIHKYDIFKNKTKVRNSIRRSWMALDYICGIQ